MPPTLTLARKVGRERRGVRVSGTDPSLFGNSVPSGSWIHPRRDRSALRDRQSPGHLYPRAYRTPAAERTLTSSPHTTSAGRFRRSVPFAQLDAGNPYGYTSPSMNGFVLEQVAPIDAVACGRELAVAGPPFPPSPVRLPTDCSPPRAVTPEHPPTIDLRPVAADRRRRTWIGFLSRVLGR
jgi:hypothetical protein